MAVSVNSDTAIEYILRLSTDRAAAAKAVADIKGVKAELKDVQSTGDQLGKKLADLQRVSNIDTLGASFGKLGKDIKDADGAAALLAKRLESIGANSSEIDRAAAAFANASNAAEGGTGGGGPSKLTKIGASIRGLPSTPIPGTGITTDAVGNVLRVLGQLPSAVIPVVAVLGAAAVAFGIMQKQLEDVKKATEAAVASNKAYYDAIGQSKTTDEAKARIEELKQLIAGATGESANLTQANAAAFKAAQSQYGDFAARLIFAAGGVAQSTDDVNKKVAEYQGELAGLQRAVDSNALAAADLAAKEKALQEARDKTAEEGIARAVKNADLLRNATTDQLDESIAKIQDSSRAIYAALADSASGLNKLSDEELAKLNKQLKTNEQDIADLTGAIYDAAKAREREKEMAKEQAAAMNDINKIQAGIDDAIAKRADDVAKLEEKHAASLQKLADTYAQGGIEAGIKQQQKLADLQTDYQRKIADDAAANQQKEQDILEKSNETKIKIEEDYQKRVREIEREYNRTSTDAIQNRDAVALDTAKRKRDEDLKDASDKRSEATKAQEADQQKQLRDLQQNIQQQAQQRLIDYQRRVQDANLAFQRDAEARARKYQLDQQQLAAANQAELNQRNAAFRQQLANLSDNLSQRLKTEQGYYGAVLQYAIDTKNRINSILGYSGGSTAPAADIQPLPGQITPTAFASGGFTRNGGRALLHPGEMVLNPQQQRSMGVTFAPVINGGSRRQIETEMVRHMKTFLDSAGY